MNVTALTNMAAGRLRLVTHEMSSGITSTNRGAITDGLVQADSLLSQAGSKLLPNGVRTWEINAAQSQIAEAVTLLADDQPRVSSVMEHVAEAIRHTMLSL